MDPSVYHGKLTHGPTHRRLGRLASFAHNNGVHTLCDLYKVVVDEYSTPYSELIFTRDGDSIDVTNQDAVNRPKAWHYERV